MSNPRTALVLGATGGIGGEVARRLAARGWSVRALHRAAGRRRGADGLDWRQGDAMRPADVAAAAEGAALIVHAVNPPGYRDWDRLVLPMLENTIAAARATGARDRAARHGLQLRPGRLPADRREAPQHPVTRKGAIRVAMEARLRAAADGRRAVLVVRAGDFFGPRAGNNWFSQGLVKPGRPLRARSPCRARPASATPGPTCPTSPRPWRASSRRERAAPLRELPLGRPLGPRRHGDGRGDPPRRSASRLPLRRFPWRLLRLAARRAAVPRAAEMRYLWHPGPARQPPPASPPSARSRTPRSTGRCAKPSPVSAACPARPLAPLPARGTPRISCRLADLESGGLESVMPPQAQNKQRNARAPQAAMAARGRRPRHPPQPALRISCSREAVRANSKAPAPSR